MSSGADRSFRVVEGFQSADRKTFASDNWE